MSNVLHVFPLPTLQLGLIEQCGSEALVSYTGWRLKKETPRVTEDPADPLVSGTRPGQDLEFTRTSDSAPNVQKAVDVVPEKTSRTEALHRPRFDPDSVNTKSVHSSGNPAWVKLKSGKEHSSSSCLRGWAGKCDRLHFSTCL